jgi:hypothetical protein
MRRPLTASVLLAAGLALLALGGCKREGPSSADLTGIYRSAIEVISCAKVQDSVYRCRFRFTNPPTPADQGEHTQCFFTDGTAWNLKVFC